MPVENSKIIEQLKTKFPGVRLSKDRLNAIAAKLSPKIDDETKIGEKLDELNEIHPFDEIAKYDDWQTSKKAKDAASQQKNQGSSNTNAGTDDDDNDDDASDKNQNTGSAKVPKYVKDLLSKVDNLTNQVTALNTQKQQESIKQKLSNNDKLKDIPKSFYLKRALPSKEEDIDAFVDEIVTDHTAFLQESGYEGLTPHTPAASTQKPGGKPKIDPDLVAYAKKQNETAVNGATAK